MSHAQDRSHLARSEKHALNQQENSVSHKIGQ